MPDQPPPAPPGEDQPEPPFDGSRIIREAIERHLARGATEIDTGSLGIGFARAAENYRTELHRQSLEARQPKPAPDQADEEPPG